MDVIFIVEGEGVDGPGHNEHYNPWPHWSYTGKLRPYPQSPVRVVPKLIPRPDYATHPTGVPISEQQVKQVAQIKTLSDDEIEGMRVACKVSQV